MQYPNFQDPQFLDAAGTGGLNAAMTALHGAISTLGSGMFSLPGITAPEAMTVAFSGLTATVTLPQPWGLVVGGAMIRAHGTQTGVDTQSYTVSFSGAVPSSGSVTAWLAATTGLIQQNPFPIPGPPPGHPSWNPNFVPTIGYAMNQDTILLSAVTGGIDNVNTFGLLSTTLSAGQTGITTWTTSGQVRADVQKAWPPLPVVGGLLTVAQAQQVLLPAASGQTNTLPRSSLCAGLPFAFVNNLSGSWTFAASGTDSIINTTGASGSSLTVPTQGAGILWTSGNSIWELLASNPSMTPRTIITNANGTAIISPDGTIYQTGIIPLPGFGVTGLFSLPIPFPTTFVNIVGNYQALLPPFTGACGFNSSGLASFFATSTGPGVNGASWIAIGY